MSVCLPKIVLSFDIEEHHQIEAAAGLRVSLPVRERYAEGMEQSTYWVLEKLAAYDVRATFFLVGQVARSRPWMVQAIHEAGHEIGSHSWSHRRIHRHTPASFREDTRTSKDILEQTIGAPVLGYRAPTFSVVRETAWALDVLVELGFEYDSSIFPVRHDRYGVPDAPRAPFLARGYHSTLLELPLLTWRSLGWNVPVGGGGYFRLLPSWVLERGLAQATRNGTPPVAVLYFHPWEFDRDQPRLPLGTVDEWRTYVGIGSTRKRLRMLLEKHRFQRAIDVAVELKRSRAALETFSLPERQPNAAPEMGALGVLPSIPQ